MKIILNTDVAKVGKKNQIIEVSDGYAMNFLIKKGLAVAADNFNLHQLQVAKDKAAQDEANKLAEAKKLAEKLEKLCLEIGAKRGKDGQMYGSVSNKQVEQELLRHGFEIDKRKIENKGINTFGTTVVKVELHKGVIATFKVKVFEI